MSTLYRARKNLVRAAKGTVVRMGDQLPTDASPAELERWKEDGAVEEVQAVDPAAVAAAAPVNAIKSHRATVGAEIIAPPSGQPARPGQPMG